MTDRLRNKIRESRSLADEAGLDVQRAPMLVTFEMPIWGAAASTGELGELARMPGTMVAVMSVDPLPDARRAVASSPNLHVVAERGLVCGLSGGAELHVYPGSPAELASFSVALLTGAAPDNFMFSLSPFRSSGRQEVTFEEAPVCGCTARELLHAIRLRDGIASFAGEEEKAVVVIDDPQELETVRMALTHELPGRGVRCMRMPSGRFRLTPDTQPRPVARERVHVLAQEIALTCDRFLEARGGCTYGFATEPVARWQYSPEVGARRLAAELFDAPDTVIPQLGLHPFQGREGTLFFAYEGSETVWEAANKGIACVTVRDILEYGRILLGIRRGEAT